MLNNEHVLFLRDMHLYISLHHSELFHQVDDVHFIFHSFGTLFVELLKLLCLVIDHASAAELGEKQTAMS